MAHCFKLPLLLWVKVNTFSFQLPFLNHNRKDMKHPKKKKKGTQSSFFDPLIPSQRVGAPSTFQWLLPSAVSSCIAVVAAPSWVDSSYPLSGFEMLWVRRLLPQLLFNCFTVSVWLTSSLETTHVTKHHRIYLQRVQCEALKISYRRRGAQDAGLTVSGWKKTALWRSASMRYGRRGIQDAEDEARQLCGGLYILRYFYV